MTARDESIDLHRFEDLLKERSPALIASLEKGDFSGAMHILAELSDARNAMLYREVGTLTRGLHEAIKQFNLDVEATAASQVARDSDGSVQSEVSDANERLNYVLKLTENAANTTMDMVDASVPVASELGDQARLLREDWKKLADSESSLSELKDLGRTTESFLAEIERGSEALQKNFTEILLTQGFQDITGQLIKRVIGLVTDVEKSLLNLVLVAGKVDRITGIRQEDLAATQASTEDAEDVGSQAQGETQEEKEDEQKVKTKGEGPQVLNREVEGTVTGQDDVDDLLSSLGF